MSSQAWVYLGLFLANLIYAGNYTIAKEVMPEYLQPFGFILLRVIVACVMFWLTSLFFQKEKVERRDLLKLALCAVFGVTINQLAFFSGLALTVPINASIIMVTTPILVLIISMLCLIEKLTIFKGIGILLGASGATFLVLRGGGPQMSADTFWGDILILVNAISYGIYLVLAKPLMKKYHALTIVKWIFLFGAIYILPFGYRDLLVVEWNELSWQIWSCIAYVIIGTSFIAYLLNTMALKYVNASVVGAFIYLQPFLAAIIAISFGKDHLDSTKIIAAILIFSGVFLVSYSRKVNAN